MLREMIYLGIDCSSPYLALALHAEGLEERFTERVERDHAKRLSTALDELFARAALTPTDLGGITVGVGPGSYTGLRVGIAFAKGVAQSLSLPLRGENSLLAMAATALGDDTPEGVVALDARRGNVYAGTFRWHSGELQQQGDLYKTPRETLQEGALPYFENVVPDALYLARRSALGAREPVPIYL